MDLVPHLSTPLAPPSLLAFERDHVETLAGELTSRLPAVVGQPVSVARMNGGLLGLELPPEQLVAAVRVLRDTLGFDMLTCVSGVDMGDHLDSIYHLRSLSNNWVLQVRVSLPAERPQVDSLVGLYSSANWLEREEYDLVGITYLGHPDLRRIMLDDEFQGHPLLKSFRSTPPVVHDRATTQVPPRQALAGGHQRNLETVVSKRLGQGQEERLHPGTPTFGNMAIFSRTGQGVEPPAESADQAPGKPGKPGKPGNGARGGSAGTQGS
ncbi:MAG TPA: NADH-quinone oxidoreductase subunit C [Ktedonobacterales bacterium]|nr:NADH-quinone oxidoreductase subunit C [Ktedonobacterales bacterium]